MTHQELEARLKQAVDNAVPPVLDSVLATCEKQKGKVTVMTQSTNNKNVTSIRPMTRRIIGTAAALVVLAGAVAGFFAYRSRFAVASTVSLDVNPSVIIQVNKQETVLEVLPLNDDGRKVTGDMDFAGSDLDVTVNALVGSMLRNGYLNDLANSILVSVDNDDAAAGAALQERLAEEIDSLLNTEAFTGAVLSQTVKKDDELEKLADTYGITVGKAQLIRQITTQNTAYTFEALVPLSINELNLISESGKLHLENVASTGTASDKSYIGEAKAKAAALAHAGVKEADLAFYRCEMDYENGVLVYELDFVAGLYDYDYEINAKTGAVVKSEKEREDDIPAANNSTGSTNQGNNTASTTAGKNTSYVGEAKAKAAALAHAGVKEAELDYFTCKLDRDDGAVLYDIEFSANGYEYDYEVNASTGKVVSYERDRDDDTYVKTTKATAANQTTTKTTALPTGLLGEAKAKSIALQHAGVKEADIRGYEYEVDYENGVTVYEISFRIGNYEYEYEINAKTGDVIRSEKDYDD